MTIREFQEKDREAVKAFMEAQIDELIPFDPFKRERKEGYGEFAIQGLIEGNEGKNKIYVAEENDQIAGYICGWVKYIEDFENLTGGGSYNGMLDNLYVSPDFRKQGVAKALIARLEGYFKGEGCELIWLTVFSDNQKAVNLYLNTGYTPNSTTMIKRLKIEK